MTEYKGSPAYSAVMGATTADQLRNRKRYTLMAIDHHRQAGNADQVAFFETDLALIEKRLRQFGETPA